MNREEVIEEIEGWLEYGEDDDDDDFSISDSGDTITVSINY